ncbi:MAG: hypothetical protein WC443_06390 [Desulfobaccales bacterium]
MKLLHKALDFQVRQVGNPDDRILEFIGSTADVDRYGDIIEVGGWDLKHYLKNPQFLWAHNYSVPPVGTTRKVTKADGALAFQVYFPKDDEINVAGWPSHVPTPETVYRLYLGGFLRATSVGFQGLEWEPILGDADDQGFRPRTGTKYTKQDLYELSAVPVPANPYALMNAVQKGIISEEQVKAFDLAEYGLCKCKTCGAEFPAGTAHTCAPPESDKNDLIKGRLVKLGVPGPDGDNWAVSLLALCDLAESLHAELAEAKAQATEPHKMTLVLDEKQLEAIRQDALKIFHEQFNVEVQAKAGAVLSAKNKTALKNAQAMIQQVLDAAEPAEEGKGATPNQSIYSLALNPGIEPEGGRQAGEGENADVAELRTLTKNLHLAVCKP